MTQASQQPRTDIGAILDSMKLAQGKDHVTPAALRIDRLNRALDILVDHQQELKAAMSADFGHRSRDLSAIADIAASVTAFRHARKHLKSWMQPKRRALEFPLGITGAAGHVQYQPKGVIGIMSPWNFPINMAFAPLAGVLAAGNRAMLKPSEFTPETSALLARYISEKFDADEIYVVNGGAKVGAAFCALPFDHLVFTGSTSVGRMVMRAASENLVPVTLELGGKSPAIIGETADLERAATRILHGKIFNAGQICIAPDYVLLPKSRHQSFVNHARTAVKTMFPSGIKDNDNYTSLLGQRHYDRLQGYIQDAKEKGAEIIVLNPKNEDFSQQAHHKIPPTLIIGATDDMTVMQEEIFGPLLPIRSTADTNEAIEYVNNHARPLALYFFGNSRQEEAQVLNRTIAGGVTVNDTIMHISQENLPFGGVGASGIGRYHGHDGFLEFSHHKAVFRQMRFDLLKFLRPPYGRFLRGYIGKQIKK